MPVLGDLSVCTPVSESHAVGINASVFPSRSRGYAQSDWFAFGFGVSLKRHFNLARPLKSIFAIDYLSVESSVGELFGQDTPYKPMLIYLGAGNEKYGQQGLNFTWRLGCGFVLRKSATPLIFPALNLGLAYNSTQAPQKTADTTGTKELLKSSSASRRRPFDKIQFEVMPLGGGFYSVDSKIWGVSGGAAIAAIFNSFLGAVAEFQAYRLRKYIPQSTLQREYSDFSYSLMFHHTDDIKRVFFLLGLGRSSGQESWEVRHVVPSPLRYRSSFAVPSFHLAVGLSFHLYQKLYFSSWLKKQNAGEFSVGGSSHSFNTFSFLSGLQYRF